MTNQEFEGQWQAAARQVERACRYALPNPDLCADVVQQVAIRAWRGSATFRGDCPFALWVQRIAKNEIARAIQRLARERRRDAPLEDLDESKPEAVAKPKPPETVVADHLLRESVEQAAAAGELTAQECQCVRERLNRPEDSWDSIGAVLGINGAHAAVVHCRAIPKLRAWLFVHHRDEIAPPGAIAAAFRDAASDASDPLTEAENQAFRRMVLQPADGAPRRRDLGAFRGACGKIIRHLGRQGSETSYV
jgi:RNA polymerase sigma factor (sigma-70 family)